jgi:hypothetical protein
MKISTVSIEKDGSYRLNGNTFVPDKMDNRYRVMIQEWIDEGNTPDPYVEPEPHWIDKRLANMENGGYGSIGEQLDMLYWDKKNGTDNWEKHIDKVKSDIPKE